jgi:hypothetical protein
VVGKLAHGEAGLAKRLDAWIASTAQVWCACVHACGRQDSMLPRCCLDGSHKKRGQ